MGVPSLSPSNAHPNGDKSIVGVQLYTSIVVIDNFNILRPII
jgi:hypothetical protein